MIQLEHVNLWAIAVGVAISFLIGGLWYSLLFCKPWMEAMGINLEDVGSSNLSMPRALFGSVLASSLTAVGLGLLLSRANPVPWHEGFLLAGIVWLAFSMTPMLKMVFWEDRPWRLLAIDGGYEFVSIAAVTAVLIAWR